MDNYKIKVKDEAVFAEVVALCEQISGKSFPYPNISCDPDLWIFIGPEGAFGWSLDPDHSWSGLDLKELTLPQLRDLVVLKRNDVKDANYIDKKREAWYLASDGTYYAWQYRKLCWDTESDACVKAYDIKPINQPQDPALISGSDVPALIKAGKEVQFRSVFNVQGGGEWKDFDPERDEEEFSLGDLINTRFEWRLKPQTIKLELELPKPFEPKVGEEYFYLNSGRESGFAKKLHDGKKLDYMATQFGAWRTEDEIKQVVAQLRKIRGAS
ncbi:hypothetical protein NLV80_000793 [Acinetobacter baumannii]|nr:hypothetical protein [Acinetobacter baumannii]EKT9845629.1 hypothetical protein [Acinetobacter baumannii]